MSLFEPLAKRPKIEDDSDLFASFEHGTCIIPSSSSEDPFCFDHEFGLAPSSSSSSPHSPFISDGFLLDPHGCAHHHDDFGFVEHNFLDTPPISSPSPSPSSSSSSSSSTTLSPSQSPPHLHLHIPPDTTAIDFSEAVDQHHHHHQQQHFQHQPEEPQVQPQVQVQTRKTRAHARTFDNDHHHNSNNAFVRPVVPLAVAAPPIKAVKIKAPRSPRSPFCDDEVEYTCDPNLRVSTMAEFRQHQDELARMKFADFSNATQDMPDECKKDSAFKTLAKRIKNREAARKSRKRSREKMEDTRNHERFLETENRRLHSQLEDLQKRYSVLLEAHNQTNAELRDLRSIFNSQISQRLSPSSSSSSSSTSPSSSPGEFFRPVASHFGFDESLFDGGSGFGHHHHQHQQQQHSRSPSNQRTQMVSFLIFLLLVCVGFTVFSSDFQSPLHPLVPAPSNGFGISSSPVNTGRVLHGINGNVDGGVATPFETLSATRPVKMIDDKPAHKRFVPLSSSSPSSSSLRNKIRIAPDETDANADLSASIERENVDVDVDVVNDDNNKQADVSMSVPLSQGPSKGLTISNALRKLGNSNNNRNIVSVSQETLPQIGNETLVCSPRDEAIVEIIDQKSDSISFLVKTSFLNQTMNLKIPSEYSDISDWSSVTCTNFVINIFPTVDLSQPLPVTPASSDDHHLHHHQPLALS